MGKTIIIDDKLYKEITEFCSINDISDVENYFGELLRKALTFEKYGTGPLLVAAPIVEEKSEEIVKDEEKIPTNKTKIDDYGLYD